MAEIKVNISEKVRALAKSIEREYIEEARARTARESMTPTRRYKSPYERVPTPTRRADEFVNETYMRKAKYVVVDERGDIEYKDTSGNTQKRIQLFYDKYLSNMSLFNDLDKIIDSYVNPNTIREQYAAAYSDIKPVFDSYVRSYIRLMKTFGGRYSIYALGVDNSHFLSGFIPPSYFLFSPSYTIYSTIMNPFTEFGYSKWSYIVHPRTLEKFRNELSIAFESLYGPREDIKYINDMITISNNTPTSFLYLREYDSTRERSKRNSLQTMIKVISDFGYGSKSDLEELATVVNEAIKFEPIDLIKGDIPTFALINTDTVPDFLRAYYDIPIESYHRLINGMYTGYAHLYEIPLAYAYNKIAINLLDYYIEQTRYTITKNGMDPKSDPVVGNATIGAELVDFMFGGIDVYSITRNVMKIMQIINEVPIPYTPDFDDFDRERNMNTLRIKAIVDDIVSKISGYDDVGVVASAAIIQYYINNMYSTLYNKLHGFSKGFVDFSINNYEVNGRFDDDTLEFIRKYVSKFDSIDLSDENAFIIELRKLYSLMYRDMRDNAMPFVLLMDTEAMLRNKIGPAYNDIQIKSLLSYIEPVVVSSMLRAHGPKWWYTTRNEESAGIIGYDPIKLYEHLKALLTGINTSYKMLMSIVIWTPCKAFRPLYLPIGEDYTTRMQTSVFSPKSFVNGAVFKMYVATAMNFRGLFETMYSALERIVGFTRRRGE